MLDGKRNGFKIEKSSPSKQLFDNYKAAIEWHETCPAHVEWHCNFMVVLFKHFGTLAINTHLSNLIRLISWSSIIGAFVFSSTDPDLILIRMFFFVLF